MTALAHLNPHQVGFPPADGALRDPNGLLAVGGALTPQWLLCAYSNGIFPWFDDDDSHIMWWSPDPRAVLKLDEFKVSRSLRKRLRNGGMTVTFDQSFSKVVDGCSAPRADANGTWITPAMRNAYCQLHQAGFAHSGEVWQNTELVGGLYGLSLGRMFFGESMYSRVRDASKVALYCLVMQLRRWNFDLIDCQIMNDHLASLGATSLPRATFLRVLAATLRQPTRTGPWVYEADPYAGTS